ncbi:MAG: T9SS type A sorting domain-containing protein [Chitinophagaceae bacterium]
MRKIYLLLIVFCFAGADASAQVNFNANTAGSVPPYTGNYLFGSNAGIYQSWNIFAMADIEAGNPGRNIKGVGIKTMHQPLPEYFFADWGYDVYLNLFAYYNRLGIKDNTIWFEGPTAAHKDNTIYPGCSEPSKLWSNLYEPIWDGGANGTPVNENNYLALYVYNTVTRYKQWVKFWEIVNEPDLDNSVIGWKTPGAPGNWWENNPNPCDLVNLKAPIYNYIRTLRITYEVVKAVDPTAYVSMGGVGYPSFLDAMLRNTDNPAGGAVSTDYPFTGGAYFDLVSFHYYPMYDLRYVDNNFNIVPIRYSDAAIDQYISRKNVLTNTLYKRGYNDTIYPKKIFICTENNIPRKPFPGPDGFNFIGSDEAQRNYDMKAVVASQLNDIKQLYIFSIGDSKDFADATGPFDVVGFYQNLNGKGPGPNANDTIGPYLQQYNNSGIAYKTLSDALSGFKADTIRTKAMNMPANVRGGAFKNPLGDYVYVLWAATSIDNSEAASATYSFPASINVPAQMYLRNWDYLQTNSSPLISPQNIALTGSPSIIMAPLIITALKPDTVRSNPAAYFSFTLYPNPVSTRLTIKLHAEKRQTLSIKITDAMGQLVVNVADNTTYNTGDNFIQVPISSRMAAGIYYCRMVTVNGNRDQIVKFIVTK